ncbi:MAG: hypothetical protein DWQ39_11160 [Bacteroidetes bacterium]|nr:MAG: hypothetical protein DWQ33_11485 [Bacteroidota bacterium]REK00705.1 MAG: hypothetical protein DWQ39_11160 [Bacteroidota bacterium]
MLSGKVNFLMRLKGKLTKPYASQLAFCNQMEMYKFNILKLLHTKSSYIAVFMGIFVVSMTAMYVSCKSPQKTENIPVEKVTLPDEPSLSPQTAKLTGVFSGKEPDTLNRECKFQIKRVIGRSSGLTGNLADGDLIVIMYDEGKSDWISEKINSGEVVEVLVQERIVPNRNQPVYRIKNIK